jgi:hypothetical protein
VAHGLAPYWRLAYEQRWDRNSLSAGVYGIQAKVHPGNGTALQGVSDDYKDAAADVQYQFIGENHLATLMATYIHESQTLSASVIDLFAANATNNLKTFKLTAEYTRPTTILYTHWSGSISEFGPSHDLDLEQYSHEASPRRGILECGPVDSRYVAWR